MSIRVTTYVPKTVLISRLEDDMVRLTLRSKELEAELSEVRARVIKGPHDDLLEASIKGTIDAIGDEMKELAFKRTCIEEGAEEPKTEIDL